MELHNLSKQKNFKSKAKIVGRGAGSGKGAHTVGRGMNGQRSRSGGSKNPRVDFEGGQNPISRRLPKLRGFKRGFDKSFVVVVPTSAVDMLDSGEITEATLVERGIVNIAKCSMPNFAGIKIVSNGKITKKFELKGIKCSASVKNQIEALGGSVA
jgi:large subunit ribosomal protein L15